MPPTAHQSHFVTYQLCSSTPSASLLALPCFCFHRAFLLVKQYDHSRTDHQVFSLPPVRGACYVRQLPCID
jgi:hypothetical protein